MKNSKWGGFGFANSANQTLAHPMDSNITMAIARAKIADSYGLFNAIDDVVLDNISQPVRDLASRLG